MIVEGVSVPMQICFDSLPAGAQPASHMLSFAAAWSSETDGPQVLRGAIARWRGIQR